MKFSLVKSALTVITLVLSAGLAVAANNMPETMGASKAKDGATSAKPQDVATAKIKLIDINSAKKEELKKLPGISDAEAVKIIAGRPYGSKAWLVSRKIIDAAVYEGLKQQVIAKQPNKDAAKNAELYIKKK